MSLSQFINKLNIKRFSNQLRIVERYKEKYANSNIIIKIYDEGLHFYDTTRKILVLDLNVIQ